ncbi:glycosyltransferase family 4 protein [Thiobacillus sp.]|uniref:glycosyltransferase family 4 protein n=1 Tax=Thiobacillus sp. TaxID=924 RepID=UPI0025F7030C|nr:glycosyltransferase family 4 protein [Thiobacillus sp.]MBT9538271.1 glycosyltransferase family 4 protein [Thiobacillus sp.]
MKILLSAFAFAPNVGSEPGVGWRWAAELAKQHEVTVVTDATRRPLVEAAGVQLPANMEVVYYRPTWLRAMPLNSTTAQVLYTLWQFGLLGLARRLHRNHGFDLAIHITYGVFRHPSFLGYLGIPFIFGPLGGGEDAPLALKRSIRGREKLKELLRSLLNKAALFDPFLWMAFAKTTLILTKTEDTRRALPWPFRRRAVVYPEIGIDAPKGIHPCPRHDGEPLRVLFAGRLLGWKGAHLAIRAVAHAMERGVPVEFTLLGRGPFEAELRKVAMAEGIHDRIRWISQMPQQELFALYRTMHCFLFPSLHDSSGNVVLEAQAFGLPVICLDIGGPVTLVTSETAVVVSTRNQNEQGVIQHLADAVKRLADNEPGRLAMSQASLDHVRGAMSWGNRAYGVFPLMGLPQHGD